MKLHSLLALIFLLIQSCQNPNKIVSKSTEKPNVLLIVVDDLGYKDLAYTGSDFYETPYIDKLAREGIVFKNAYASAANCAPSRASMLSGLYSPRHKVFTVNSSARGNSKTRRIIPTPNTNFLEDSTFTLADMFKDEGYVTASFGKWHIGRDPKNQGIDYNVGGNQMGSPGKDGYFSPYKIKNIEDGPVGEYLTDRLTNEAISFLDTHQDTSFFLYLPYYTVHTPLMGKEKLIDKFEQKPPSEGQSNATYAAMVSSMDSNVGKLLSYLEDLNLDRKTIIIFTSDNGGIRAISSQAPLRAGKGSYYEGGIRVPLILRWPNGFHGGREVNERVSNLDFFPTLHTMIGGKESQIEFDGIDFSPLLHGDTLATRNLFWHFPIYLQAYNMKKDDARDPLFRTRPGSVLISDDWKLHEYFEDGKVELYNLAKDPGERINLAQTNTSKADSMYQILLEWREKVDAPVPTETNPEYDKGFERNLIAKNK